MHPTIQYGYHASTYPAASAAAEIDSNTAYETEEGDSPGSPSRSIVDIGGDAIAPVHHESL